VGLVEIPFSSATEACYFKLAEEMKNSLKMQFQGQWF